jgi:hypothetical protein
MRVTKIIKEYVEKTVSALPKFKKESAEEIAYNEMHSKIENFKVGVANEVENFVKEAIDRFKKENNIPDDVEIKFQSCYYPISSSMWASDIKTSADKKKNERTSAKHKAIEEILVNLELGGTKAELDEMLRKLAE